MLCVEVADVGCDELAGEEESVTRFSRQVLSGEEGACNGRGGWNEMQARDQAESMLRILGRREYCWWNSLDRDGMERVSDWVVCVLLLLCASGS